MKYYKHNETGVIYAYTQADIDAADGITELELALANAQAALDALPEPTDTGEPDTAREADVKAVKDVLPVFFDIRQKLKDMTDLTGAELEAHLNPKPTTEQALAVKIAEAKKYLLDTDHKFYIGYVPKDGEDLDATLALRNEKREFIRANE